MAVNLYDSPAQAKFVNTYVPIKFDQLYKISDQADKRIEAGTKIIDDLEGYQSLGSISDVDNAIWDEQIYRPVMDYIDTNVKNSYDLNNPEVISGLKSLKRKLTANPLSAALITSKKNLEEAAKNVSPEFSDVYGDIFRGHNTVRDGSFIDAPIKYEGWEAGSKPYFDDVGPRYLGNNGLYRVYGVSPDDIDAVSQAKADDIVTNPQFRMLALADERRGLIPREYYSADEEGQPFLSEAGMNKYIFDRVRNAGMDKTIKREEKADQVELNNLRMRQALGIAKMKEAGANRRAAAANQARNAYVNYYTKLRADAYNNTVNNAVRLLTDGINSLMRVSGVKTAKGFRDNLIDGVNKGNGTMAVADYMYAHRKIEEAKAALGNTKDPAEVSKLNKEISEYQSVMAKNEAGFAEYAINYLDYTRNSGRNRPYMNYDAAMSATEMMIGKEFTDAFASTTFGKPATVKFSGDARATNMYSVDTKSLMLRDPKNKGRFASPKGLSLYPSLIVRAMNSGQLSSHGGFETTGHGNMQGGGMVMDGNFYLDADAAQNVSGIGEDGVAWLKKNYGTKTMPTSETERVGSSLNTTKKKKEYIVIPVSAPMLNMDSEQAEIVASKRIAAGGPKDYNMWSIYEQPDMNEVYDLMQYNELNAFPDIE